MLLGHALHSNCRRPQEVAVRSGACSGAQKATVKMTITTAKKGVSGTFWRRGSCFS